eukprot:SAG25_NODE_2553_length_1537_cov_1.336579_1_plen_126_part_00
MWGGSSSIDEAPALSLACGADVCPTGECRFFDIWSGVEITDSVQCDEDGLTPLPTVVLEAGGYGAVLRSADGSAPPEDMMAQMAAYAAFPLRSFDDEWRPLQQQLRTVRPIHLGCGGCGRRFHLV